MMNRRRVPGLASVPVSKRVPEGRLLVRVDRILYIGGQKPYFALSYQVEQPTSYAGQQIQSRLYCTERALWKLSWFLRDFGYDQSLLNEEQIDAKAVLGLKGVIRVSRVSVNGRAFTNLDAFAPASTWDEPHFPAAGTAKREREVNEEQQEQA
jgi:hypothetical protein